MRNSSIRTKMLAGITVPVLVVFLLAGYLIASSVGNSVTALTTDKLGAESGEAAYQVSGFFNSYLKGVQHAAANYQVVKILKATPPGTPLTESEGYTEMKTTLDALAATDSQNILSSWIGDFDSSQITQSDGYTSPPGWDITARPWYQVTKTRGPVLTQPYVDASTGELIISTAAPVSDPATGEIIGACGYDIRLAQLGVIMSGYKIGREGFIILCTGEGQMIYHPNSQYIQKSISEVSFSENIRQAVLNGQEGEYAYTMDGSPYQGSVNRVGDTGWLVISGMPESEVLSAFYTVLGVIVAVFAAGLAILFLMILLISKGITRPLKKLAGAANRIAGGDLDVRVEVLSHDETGQVGEAMIKTVDRLKKYMDYIDEISRVLNQIAENDLVFELQYDYTGEFYKIREAMLKIRSTLTRTLERITMTADQVASGSEQVAVGSQALAQGATEQASSIECLADSIEKISQNIQDNARNASGAGDRASSISKDLARSNEQMQSMIQAMEEINRSAGEIGKIIKTIEDIALQTNLLALNAAVEAARAGQAGKGFAVVADEVRNLAGKSAQAAKNTTVLIEGAIKAVENGSRIAGSAADALLSVVDSTRQMTRQVVEISQATQEQSGAIADVTLGMDQISSVVQTNSATAEESAAASEELSGQAKTLKALVNGFKLMETDASGRSAGSPC